MPKLIDPKLKDEIKIMVSKNTPIRTISKNLNLPISTVHYNIRKISKSYRKLYQPKPDESDEEGLGEVLGIIAGDGSIFDRDYVITITLSYKEINYAKYVKKLFLKVLGKNFNFYFYPKRSTSVVKTRSMVIYNLIRKYLKWEKPKVYSICLKERNHSKLFFKGFMRGLFDTDGNIDDWGGYKRLTISSSSKNLINDVKHILKLFEISFYIREYRNTRIRIDKENAVKFIKTFGTNNDRYSTRGNSLTWL